MLEVKDLGQRESKYKMKQLWIFGFLFLAFITLHSGNFQIYRIFNLHVSKYRLFHTYFSKIFLVNSSEDEERLVRDLFRGYNKLIRPVQNMTQKVAVRFGLAFVQLINVNEKNQIMKSNVWLRLVWYDYQLQWDEADYGGIGVLRLPPDKVWKPDIVLFNK